MRFIVVAAGLAIWSLVAADADECMDKVIAQPDMDGA